MKKVLNTILDSLEKDFKKIIAGIFGESYSVWVIHTAIEANLYFWKNWKEIYPEIDSLVKISNSQPYIKTFQSFEFENKWLGFGRMKWNEKNNRKWTSKYRSKEFVNRNLRFFSTEIWTPDWNYCYKTDNSPEVYVNLFHLDFKNLKEGLIIAIPHQIAKKNINEIDLTIRSILTKIPQANLSKTERPWTPNRKFQNRIEDMNPHEILTITQI